MKIAVPSLILSALLLLGATYRLWQNRFEPVNAKALVNPDFSQGLSGWQALGEGVALEKEDGTDVLSLSCIPGKPSPRVRQVLMPSGPHRYVRIRCSLSCDELQIGSASRRRGRLVFYPRDEEGTIIWAHHHFVATLDGTRDWEAFEKVFRIGPGSRQLCVSFQNYGQSGTFRAKELLVMYVRDRVALRWHVPLLLLGWGAWIVLLLKPVMRVPAGVGRCVLGAAAVLIVVWWIAIPGTRTRIVPFWPGSFVASQDDALHTERARATDTGDVPRGMEEPTEKQRTDPDAVSGEAAAGDQSTPEQGQLDSRSEPLASWAERHWDWREWNWPYAVVFFALALLLFSLTGTGRAWPICAGVFAVTQGIELHHYGSLDLEELFEAIGAAVGMAAAYLMWLKASRALAGLRAPEQA